jgi:pimeloyl-ACP methyl ester carboxylesterase
MESATGMPVIMVGHSMGGLAIRAWLIARSAEARVHHVFTIGAPHRGTWLARHSTATNGRQMRIGSSWVARLAANEPSWRPERMTCFYSDCDNIVFPMACATLDGAENIHVSGLGHVRLAFEESIVETVCRSALASPGALEHEREADDQSPGSVDVKH